MTVFADALAVQHADDNFATAAEFKQAAASVWTSLRAIVSRPQDAVPGFAQPGNRAGALQATVLAADIAAVATKPVRNDQMRIDGTVYRVESAEKDVLGLSWLITLALP